MPRFLACLIIFLTAASDRSSNGEGASAESFSGASAALSSFSLSFTCSVFALLAIHCSQNALMQDTSPRPLESDVTYDAERAAQTSRHPRIRYNRFRTHS